MFLNYTAPPEQRRANLSEPNPRAPISLGWLKAFARDPLRMLYSDIFWVVDPERVAIDPKTGIVSKVKDPTGGNLQPFYPTFEQHTKIAYRLRCLQEGVPFNVITVKARRIGETTNTLMMMLAENLFSMKGSVNIVCADPDNVKAVYRMIETALTNLPPEIIPDPRPQGPNLPNCSTNGIRVMVPSRKGGVPGCDFTINLISAEKGNRVGIGSGALHNIWTEFAKWSSDQKVMQGIGSTPLRSTRAFKAIESTAEGKGNQHYKRVMEAWVAQGRCNWWEEGFNWSTPAPDVAFFYPWWECEAYREAFPEDIKPSALKADLTEYERELFEKCLIPRAKRAHGFSDEQAELYALEQLYWFRGLNVSIYSLTRPIRPPKLSIDPPPTEEFRRSEFPSYIEEAFTDTNISFVPGDVIDERRKQCRRPDQVGELDEEGRFRENPSGWLKLWLGEGAVRKGERCPLKTMFSIGGDVAIGNHPENPRHDLSTIVVIGSFNLTQYMEVNERIPIQTYKDYLLRVAKFCSGGAYRNYPLVCVESNGPGQGIVQELVDIYPDPQRPDPLKLYYCQNPSAQGMPDTHNPGFNPSVKKLEALAWSTLLDYLRDGMLTVRSPDCMDQLSILVQNRVTQKVEAPNKGDTGLGSKDDIADGLKMSLWHVVSLLMKGRLETMYPCYTPDGEYLGEFDEDITSPLHPRAIAQQKREEWESNRHWWQPRDMPEGMPDVVWSGDMA